jgi:hypothetical protein
LTRSSAKFPTLATGWQIRTDRKGQSVLAD